jgi:uncharacterized membrane protein YphA (DoxX/SURF4 family)
MSVLARPSLAGWCCGAAIGLVLLAAGIAKRAQPDWLDQASALGVTRSIARWVPWTELVLGAALITGVAYPLSPVAAAVLCAAFTAVVVRAVAAGKHQVCACFGNWSARPVGATTVMRNVVLTVLAVAGAAL